MTSLKQQTGATLIVALVILTMLAFLGLSAYQTSSIDLKSAGNVQARNEAMNAAQEAIETALSTQQFVSTPAAALPSPCGGVANVFCSDHDGDGVPEYTVRLQPVPTCVGTKVIKVNELNVSDAEDLGCAVGQAQQFGVAGAASGDSLCANTTWNVTAEASSATSGAKVTVSQGAGIRISVDDMASTCL